MHAAALKCHSGVLAEIVNVQKTEKKEHTLIESAETMNATLAIRDKEGKTALHYAQEMKHAPSVMVLCHACHVGAVNNALSKLRSGHRAAGEIDPKDVFQPKNPAQEAYMARIIAKRLTFRAQSWRWPAGETFDEHVLRGTATVMRVFCAKQGKSRQLELAKAMFG